MAQQPTDGDIDMFLALVPGIARSEVLLRLKDNNNNVEQAVNEYYDSPGSGQKYQYDESLFHTDRDGTNNTPSVSFQVHSPDEHAPVHAANIGRYDGPSATLGGMSRPPSRANNKSPLSSVIDLTTDHPNGAQSTMYYSDDGDRELQEALAASRAEAGLPPQATGTTNTAQVFGPANRDQYEAGQWEMVPLGVSSREILLDPEPIDRKRDINVPAFLKPSVAEHRLGALITMYHEIPAVREVFIDRKRTLEQWQYGYHPEWWNGHDVDINMPEGVELVDEVPTELQRLMSFLDKTDRSYGSVESLANLKDVKKARRRHAFLESAVMAAWKSSPGTNPAGVKKIFSRGVQCESEEDGEVEEFAILELTYPAKDSPYETIYDIADYVLWPQPTELIESSYLSHMAEVIVFKLSANSVNHKKVDIPAVWYPDRYMKQNRLAAWDMRRAKHEILTKLDQIAALEERLTNFPARNGKILKVRDLFAASLRHDEAIVNVDEATRNTDDMDGLSFQSSGKTAKLSAQLESVLASIDRKLIALGAQREEAISALREMSQLLTKQSEDPNAPKLMKYLLRGVSTTKDVTYICRRAEPDLIEMDLDDSEPKEKGDQWWRIAYVSEGYNARTVVNKVTEEEVLEAAKNESSSVLLVYASEKAMNAEVLPLPHNLETFVQWDNASFKREFPASPVEIELPLPAVSSPPKRKFDNSDCSSPVRDSDREFHNSAEPIIGWEGTGDAKSTSRNINSRANGVQEDNSVNTTDPTLLSNDHIGDMKGMEMQERVNAPLLSQMRRTESDNTSLETIDHMDMDDTVVEDDRRAEESPAVKQVEFRKQNGM